MPMNKNIPHLNHPRNPPVGAVQSGTSFGSGRSARLAWISVEQPIDASGMYSGLPTSRSEGETA